MASSNIQADNDSALGSSGEDSDSPQRNDLRAGFRLFLPLNGYIEPGDWPLSDHETSDEIPESHYLLLTDWMALPTVTSQRRTSRQARNVTKTFSDAATLQSSTAMRRCCLSEPCGVVVPMRRIRVGNSVLINCSVELVARNLTNMDHEGFSISDLLNWAFALPFMVSRDAVCLDDVINQDIILSAVLEGWDTTLGRGNICPLWGLLRIIDDHCFWCAGQVNRLALLRIFHDMLLVHNGSKTVESLPQWYRPRTRQYENPHEIIVSYWPWPRFRERCVDAPQRILSNQLWADLAQEFVFSMPCDGIEDICILDQRNDRLQFTRTFLEAVGDITKFQCREGFFRKHPELQDDIGSDGSVAD